ncbi:hypothetical protein ACJX0J_010364, partial [Zea mays]
IESPSWLQGYLIYVASLVGLIYVASLDSLRTEINLNRDKYNYSASKNKEASRMYFSDIHFPIVNCNMHIENKSVASKHLILYMLLKDIGVHSSEMILHFLSKLHSPLKQRTTIIPKK